MVLSNKKLKQKLRSQLAESLSKSESQINQPNLNDSETHQSFKSLLNSATLKPKLSKREIRRVKAPSVQESSELENGVVERESGGGLKENKKRKREKTEDGALVNDLSEKRNNKKKKKNKKNKKKKVVKKEEEDGGENGANEEQAVVETIQPQISKEDESISTKIYVGGIPYYSTVDDIQSFFQGCGSITEIDCLKFPETGKFNGIAMISFRTDAAAKRALALDGSDMGGLSLKVQPYKPTREKKVSDFAPAMLDGYNRIYVGNLSWDITEIELKKFFSDCNISSIRLGKDKETGEFKGFAHVDFTDNLSLTIALKLDQKPLFGRPVRVRCAVPPKSANPSSQVEPTAAKNGDMDNDDMARKAKSQTCYECGEKGHLSSFCPNKKIADVAVDAEVDNKLKRRTCYECGEKGHLSSLCPNKKVADVAYTGGEGDDVVFYKPEGDNVTDAKLRRRSCYECGEKGHLSSLCPNKKAADVAYTGGRVDDMAFYKEEGDNISDAKFKRRSCYECGEKGHLSSLCPNKKAAADVAYTGGETFASVAVKEVNPVSDGKLRRRTCYECGERGHLSSLCPKKQTADVANPVKESDDMEIEKAADVAVVGKEVSEGKLRRRTCYECGERGHLSSLCPKKQSADGAKESDDVAVEEVKSMAVVSDGKLRRRTCYECGLKGHVSSLCPNKGNIGVTA